MIEDNKLELQGFSEKYDIKTLVRRGGERELEIIGEATNRILKINPNIDISNARRKLVS